MLKKITAILLAVVMCISVIGCGNKEKDNSDINKYSTIGTADGKEIPMAMYKLNMMYVHQQILASGFNGDMQKDKYGDKSVAEYIEEQALINTKELIAVSKLFDEKELTLTAEEEENIKAGAEEMYNVNKILFETVGIEPKDTLDYQSASYKLQKLFGALYGEGGEFEDTKEEKLKTYEDYFYGAYLIPYLFVDEQNNPLEEQELAKVKAKSEADLERIKNGEDIADIIYEILSTQQGAEEQKPERRENNQYILPIFKDDDPYFPPMVSAQLKDIKENEPQFIEDEYMRYIVLKTPYSEIPESTKLLSYDNIITLVKSSDFQKLIDESEASINFVIDENAKNSFKATDLETKVLEMQAKLQEEYQKMIEEMMKEQQNSDITSESTQEGTTDESTSSAE